MQIDFWKVAKKDANKSKKYLKIFRGYFYLTKKPPRHIIKVVSGILKIKVSR